MKLESKFWMVLIEESEAGWGKSDLTRVFFQEDNHKDAREYVERMSLHTADMKEEYYWVINTPVLVDESVVTEYHGNEHYTGSEQLDHIRNHQEGEPLVS